MTAPPLVSVADVTAVLQRSLTPSEALKAESVIAKASGLFRRAARQDFTPGRSTSRLKVNGGMIVLRQRPVVSVVGAVDDFGSAIAFRHRPGEGRLFVDLGSDQFVTVTYDHGDDEIPDLVRTTVADIVATVISANDDASAGASQVSETAGTFTRSVTYATWAQGGRARLAPDDLAIARSFRVKTPTVWVQRA